MNIEKIKAAALAATQGEWKTMRRGDEDCLDIDVFQSGGWNGYVTLAMNIGNKNAAHIATANPSAVLELIDRLEAAEKDAERYLKAIVDHRKGDLLCISRVQSEEFCKTADAADWDEIDHEKIMAEFELNRIADAAMKEKP